MHASILHERVRLLLGMMLVLGGALGAAQAQPKPTSTEPRRVCTPAQHVPRSDSLLRLHAASFAETAAYDSVRLASPPNSSRTVWVGEPVLTIRPGQIRRLVVKEHRNGAPVLVVHLDSTATRDLSRVTRERDGRTLATSIGGEVFQAQTVMSPLGRKIPLFNVPVRLQSALIDAVWTEFERRP